MAGMTGDLIAAVTVLIALAMACGTILACIVATHAHDEREAGERRQAEAEARDAQRPLRR